MATSSSGFRKDNKRTALAALPLQAWSLGCHLEQSEGDPVAWLAVEFNPPKSNYSLKVLRLPENQSALGEFQLDRDFNGVTVCPFLPETPLDWFSQHVVYSLPILILNGHKIV